MENLSQLKCKNCGAELDLREINGGVITCKYCKSIFTLPKENTSSTTLAFLRGGEQNLDTRHFDDAYIMYQKAAEEDPSEPEAYFGMALAKAQVQYLKDYRANGKETSSDFRMQPICYEVSEKKFTDDKNYIKAMELATSEQKAAYREKGDEIDKIRAEFCELKKFGLFYDCFICVKVSSDDGKGHTEDALLATQIYHSLKDAGYHPFYSQEEMKDRSGAKYEALILYALYSSDCMLVVCTNEDYLQTPWVKNEYTRYMKMLVEADKQRESITIAFQDTPIEKLPGLTGKIQGINLNNFDGLSRILKFVDRFASSKNMIPLIDRKDYGTASVGKKTSIKREIEKRKIEIIKGGTITVSDQTNLKTASEFLQRGDFPRAIRFCMEVIRDNPTMGKAYWFLFLAENKCTDRNDLINRKEPIENYSNFEKAISTTENAEDRLAYYEDLIERIKEQRDVYTYSEYIALPESDERTIASLTDTMFETAKQTRDSKIFDVLIKTVTDTDKYIELNLEFARIADRRKAIECYHNILNVDEGHSEALYECYIDDHHLENEIALFDYCAKDENHADIERGMFSYDFNAYAMEKLFSVALRNVRNSVSSACGVFDFLLVLIPKNNNKLFKQYLNRIIAELFKCEQYDRISNYNNYLLSLNEFDHDAYFNRVLLSRKINNPLALMKEVDQLLDDENYMSAYNAYAAKYDGKNLYMRLNDILNELNAQLKYPECIDYVIRSFHVESLEELISSTAKIKVQIQEKAQEYWELFLNRYGSCEEDLYKLDRDVTSDPNFALAKKFAEVGSFDDLSRKIDKVYKEQPQAAAKNKALDLKESIKKAEEKMRQDVRNILGGVVTVVALVLMILIFSVIIKEHNSGANLPSIIKWFCCAFPVTDIILIAISVGVWAFNAILMGMPVKWTRTWLIIMLLLSVAHIVVYWVVVTS